MEKVEMLGILYLDMRNNKIIYKQIDHREVERYSSIEDYAEEYKLNSDTCWMIVSDKTEVEYKLIKG